LLLNKKVSRETFINLCEKRVNRPFYAAILKKKLLLNIILLLLVEFSIIFWIFYKILRFFIFFGCYVYCFFEIDAVFLLLISIFSCERCDLKAFLIAFCANMGFVWCDWREYSDQFCFKWAFLICFFIFLAGRLCHFRAFYYFCQL